MKLITLAMVLVAGLLAGCGQAVPTAALATPTPTETLAPTRTLVPTVNPTLTALEQENSRLQIDLRNSEFNQQQFLCTNVIADMKYDSVMDVSTRLSAFLVQYESLSISGSFRDRIWGNALSQLHGIYYYKSGDETRWTNYFMVYFDEFGMSTGIFWIDRQCWLDSPF